jgi:hypothetical protein
MFGFNWNDGSDWTWHDVACKIADEIDAENEQLRKLVRIAIKYCDSGTCDECPIMGEDESCPYSDMARELGVVE